MLGVKSCFDVEPVVIQCLLFDALTFSCYLFVPCIDVDCRLFESAWFNPTIDCEIIVALTDEALSKYHCNRLFQCPATRSLESLVNRQRNLRQS